MKVLVRDIKYLMKAGVLKQPLAGLIFVNLFIYLLSRSNGNGEFVNMEFVWGLINISFITAGVIGYIKYLKPMIQEEVDAVELEIENNKKLMRYERLRRKFDELG
ncbi:hypothetical protein [Bacillus pumilus]|uniref:hypothetical protein n=1 Tax=Bacillus pumilus TaxID=1408 RepID=UPI00227EE929|nr:hypothetical protein [Bacillus pumilus]MCY7500162.1 hypothetical protein [Bacillus pumilus]MCY7528514.1 hypothetical protein [Bacillus pumilus]MED4439528.1 hypothetical protein [Bacillus pumilus]MED4489971.1 hypothetical protein [Bacillus pumilus]